MFYLLLSTLDVEDRDMIEDIYLKFSGKVKGIAYSIMKNNEDAEDVVNSVFVNVINYHEKFVGITEAETARLLVIYTKSVCFNLLRRKRKICFESINNRIENEDGTFSDMEIPDNVDILRELITDETLHYLKEELLKLKQPALEIVTLKYFHGMKNTEIAEILGMNASTVSTILERSLKKMRNELEAYINA